MKQALRPRSSVDEPNAFRISHPFASADLALRHEPPTPPQLANREYVLTEPATWLPIGELTSPLFNPHEFLHRALSDRFEKPARPSQLPLLDDSFDADAALAALDTVESALRRMREVSRSEEATARDELRNSLHLAAKKRQSLMATAETVSTQVASFGQVGNTAASALATDLLSLEKHSSLLSELHDARDILSLFALDSSALDAVRVSRLLSRVRAMIDAGTLTSVLSPEDIEVARKELSKCAQDLAKSVFEWMRTAVDSGNSQIIRDCAVAASHLDIEEEFIREYVNCAFKFDSSDRDQQRRTEKGIVAESFRDSTWDVLNAIKEVIPTISESFAAPSRPLASLLHLLTEKHIFAIANDKMNFLRSKMQQAKISSEEKHAPVDDSSTSNIDWPKSSTALTQNRKPGSHDLSVAREHFLNSFADILRAITKANTELFELCRVPGAADIENVFAKLPDPYRKFLSPLVRDFLETERAWVDDQLATSFFEITRIESQTPRLAPRKHSDPDVYHHYRAFYSHIASNFVDMTQRAVRCTQSSLARTLDVFRSLRALMGKPDCVPKESMVSGTKHLPSQSSDLNGEAEHCLETTLSKTPSSESFKEKGQPPDTRPESQANLHAIIEEILGCVVMNYLANAETILQAATHLLPACEEDAQKQELWVSGASPLAAYAHAIDILSQSNTTVDDFLRHVSEKEALEDAFGYSTDSEREAEAQIFSGTLDGLRSELNNGLTDLGAEAQVGVRGAVASLRIRLSAILSNQSAISTYANGSRATKQGQTPMEPDPRSESGFHIDPTPVFVSAATFLEQQLQSMVTTVSGGNREFILAELATVTREAVLDCWCCCEGPISTAGAFQLISDAKAITRAFRNRGTITDELECLSSIGELFMEGPESLWSCVESKNLTQVQASRIVKLLRKRIDGNAPPIQKVCQSLGASRTIAS